MFKEILNSEGVERLSRQQMKSVDGGGYLTGHQCQGIEYREYINRQPIESTAYFSCTYQYQRTFLGFDVGGVQSRGHVGECPAGVYC